MILGTVPFLEMNLVIFRRRLTSSLAPMRFSPLFYRSFWLLLLTVTGCATHPGKLVWHDEFNVNGRPDPANWNYEHGFVRNHELQWYQPENAFCTNGLLIIEARPAHQLNPHYRPHSSHWQNARQWIDYTSAS